MMILSAAVSILLAVSGVARAQDASSRKAATVAERFFSSDWAQADPAVAPAPPAPQGSAPEPQKPIQDRHEQVAHMSITRVAYLYYISRYEGGELSRYIGDTNDHLPVVDKPDNVVAGSYDEDQSRQNPWHQPFPYLRHYWDARKGPFHGLWGNDSSVNRAQKYFTGGYGLGGKYDRGWSARETQGHGIAWHYRNGDKALAYWYLGHAAHLLEDATVPAHVLLYPHPFKNDAYETYMWHHYHEWQGNIPTGEIASYDSLLDLFFHTADVTNDYDAGTGEGLFGRDGKKDRGRRRKGGFTEAELREEGDVLMPLAYQRVAELYLYFFKLVDRTPPQVTLVAPRSGDAGAPDVAMDSTVTLTARAVDEISGVDRHGYRFEYALGTERGWSEWRAASAGPTAEKIDFSLERGRRYAFRVSAVDAAGNRAYSATRYLSAAPSGAVAQAY
jgi:hypothetical protein